VRCAFTEPAHWLEAYGRAGGSDYPNPTWQRRPFGMITKVAKAAALRAAFPEESGDYTDAEMEGHVIVDGPSAEMTQTARVIPADEPDRVPDLPVPESIYDSEFDQMDVETGNVQSEPRALIRQANIGWEGWAQTLLGYMRQAATIEEMENWEKCNRDNLQTMRAENAAFHKSVMARLNALRKNKVMESNE
jgi:RecT family